MKHLREFSEWNPEDWDDETLDAETSDMNTMGFGFQGVMEIAIEAPEPPVDMKRDGSDRDGDYKSGDCHFVLRAIYDSIETPTSDAIAAAITRVSPRLNPLNLLDEDEPEIEVSREELLEMKGKIWEILQKAGKTSPFELNASLVAFDHPHHVSPETGKMTKVRTFLHSVHRLEQLESFRKLYGNATQWELESRREGELRKDRGHIFGLERKKNSLIENHHYTSTLTIYRGEDALESITYVYAEN